MRKNRGCTAPRRKHVNVKPFKISVGRCGVKPCMNINKTLSIWNFGFLNINGLDDNRLVVFMAWRRSCNVILWASWVSEGGQYQRCSYRRLLLCQEGEGVLKIWWWLRYLYQDGLNAFPWEPSVCEELGVVSNERQWALVEGPIMKLGAILIYVCRVP